MSSNHVTQWYNKDATHTKLQRGPGTQIHVAFASLMQRSPFLSLATVHGRPASDCQRFELPPILKHITAPHHVSSGRYIIQHSCISVIHMVVNTYASGKYATRIGKLHVPYLRIKYLAVPWLLEDRPNWASHDTISLASVEQGGSFDTIPYGIRHQNWTIRRPYLSPGTSWQGRCSET